MPGIEAGPTGGPGGDWNGDHSFSSSASVFGFHEFIEPEVRNEHPTWSRAQQYQEALVRFNLRLSENISFALKEQRNEENATVWDVQEVGGVKQLVMSEGQYKGTTLNELWEHTRQIAQKENKPDTYNAMEHRAQLSMQDELVSGRARGAVSILSHPVDAKFVQVWETQGENKVVTHNFDFQNMAGRHLSHTEASTLMKKLTDRHAVHGDTDRSYPHIFVEDKPERLRQEVQVIAKAQVLFAPKQMGGTADYPVTHVDHISRGRMTDAVYQVGNRVVHDTADSAVSLGRYLWEKHGQKGEKKKQEHQAVVPLQQVSERVTHIPRLSLGEQVQIAWKEKKTDVRVLQTLSEMGVGLGAVPLVIERLTRPEKSSIKAVEKSVARHEKKNKRKQFKKEKQLRKETGEKKLAGEKPPIKKKEKDKKRMSSRHSGKRFKGVYPELFLGFQDIQNRFHTRKILDKTRMTTTENKKRLPKQVVVERVVQPEKIKRKTVKKMLVQLVKRFERITKQVEEMKQERNVLIVDKKPEIKRKRKEAKIKQKEAVAGFSLALVVWKILSNTENNISRSDDLDLQRGPSTSPALDGMKENDGRDLLRMTIPADRQKEEVQSDEKESPWLLLSIIWYLAVIREQGMKRVHGSSLIVHRQKKKTASIKKRVLKRKNFSGVFPQTGVIFHSPS